MDEPRVGDAFGATLLAAMLEGDRPPTIGGTIPRSVVEIIERDDGFVNAAPAARYFCGPDEWQPFDRRALDWIDGRTLDIGAGAGRVALVLQDRDVPVVALDVSPGAIEVCRARGVRERTLATVESHAREAPGAYDRFALFGGNLGLLGSPEAAAGFLDHLAALAAPGAQIIAQGADPYGTVDDVHRRYHERNRANGRWPGQLRIRVRYRDLATEWFDYLLPSVAELSALVSGSAWRVDEVDDGEPPFYVARLRVR